MNRSGTERQQLTQALAHEYRRASMALSEFFCLAMPQSSPRNDTSSKLAIFDAYGRFVHHTFEFYKACIETDSRGPGPVSGQALDRCIQLEASKLMRHRADRIQRGDGASWDNDASFYREPVPPEFARDFRHVRNQLAHVLPERLARSGVCSLAEFFERYHRFVLLMFEEAYWLWSCDDEFHLESDAFHRLATAVHGPSRES